MVNTEEQKNDNCFIKNAILVIITVKKVKLRIFFCSLNITIHAHNTIESIRWNLTKIIELFI